VASKTPATQSLSLRHNMNVEDRLKQICHMINVGLIDAKGAGVALVDDILNGGNVLTGLAIGVGALVVVPLVGPVLRPAAKAAIKGGLIAYRESTRLMAGAVKEGRERSWGGPTGNRGNNAGAEPDQREHCQSHLNFPRVAKKLTG
jgi:hypothetical protein